MARVLIISIGTYNLLGALQGTSGENPKKVSDLDAKSIMEPGFPRPLSKLIESARLDKRVVVTQDGYIWITDTGRYDHKHGARVAWNETPPDINH